MSNAADGPIFVATWDFGGQAVRAAWDAWQRSRGLEDACVEATAAIELDPAIPTVGIGGLPNREGVMELDAGFMRGSDLRCGSVAALRVTCPAITVARRVSQLPSHTFLVGQGVDQFAIAEGFERYDPDALLTDKTRDEFAQRQAKVARKQADAERMVGHDTVGVLGWHAGQTVACVATSGLGFKRPGRVGDSPIIGGGLYADDTAGCVVCTGIGEELARHAVAVRVLDAMKAGAPPNEAGGAVLRMMIDRDPANASRGLALIAIDKAGSVGAATTRSRNHEFEYHVCRAGGFERVDPDPVQ